MTQPIHHALILLAAPQTVHRVWGRFDHQRPGINATHLAIAFAAVASAVVAGVAWRVLKRRAARTFSANSSAKLFRQLCATHGIKRSHRRLLRQLAEARGVVEPATLFVEPRYFEPHDLPRDLNQSAKELRTLREALFE